LSKYLVIVNLTKSCTVHYWSIYWRLWEIHIEGASIFHVECTYNTYFWGNVSDFLLKDWILPLKTVDLVHITRIHTSRMLDFGIERLHNKIISWIWHFWAFNSKLDTQPGILDYFYLNYEFESIICINLLMLSWYFVMSMNS